MIGSIPATERAPHARRLAATLPLRAAGQREWNGAGCDEASARIRRRRRGLIIDLDDTLYPRERFVRSGFAAVARHVDARFGIPAGSAYAILTRASADGGAGSEMQALCDRFGLDRSVVPTLVDVFRTHTPALFLPAESRAVLDTLRARGWSLVILTNGLPSVQFRKVAALGVAPLVDEVLYAEEHAPGGKPSAAAFRAALRALELDAADCVSVGDDPVRDVGGARALGIATVRLARPDVSVPAAEEADVVIETLTLLPEAAALLLSKETVDVA